MKLVGVGRQLINIQLNGEGIKLLLLLYSVPVFGVVVHKTACWQRGPAEQHKSLITSRTKRLLLPRGQQPREGETTDE